MNKNELLKYLICEIDLVMHDKDYRFENEDGTWYSRESCKNLTNEEVFEELKCELRQLAKIEDDFADIEAKLAESEQRCQECKHLNKKIELNIKNKLMNEIQQLKQQLAESEEKCNKQWKQIQADANHIEFLEKENKRLSKNLRISWTQRMKFYNCLLKSDLQDIRDKLNKELFDGYYESKISVGAVGVVIDKVFSEKIYSLKGE